MSFKKIILATLFSLPLLPLLILPAGSLSHSITEGDIVMAAPFAIEFMGFYALYIFTKNRSNFTRHEQKLLMLLVSGYFLILGIPVLSIQIANPSLGVSTLGFIVLLMYAFISLLINTWQVSGSSDRIGKYFTNRYFWPGSAALVAMFFFTAANVELNTVALYLIIKNYIFAFSDN